MQAKKILKQYVFPMFLCAAMISTLFFWQRGIPLSGLPGAEEVATVEVWPGEMSGEARILTKEAEIEQAVNIAGFLSWQWGEPEAGEPLIAIVYHLKDGNTQTLWANENTVFLNGKAHRIKGDNGKMFVSIAEGLFFSNPR